jgi:hypothetical protein
LSDGIAITKDYRMSSPISSLPSWILFPVTFILGILAAEAGARLTPRKQKDRITEKEGSAGALIGAILGLLAFMLGFTFSITASRFAERKSLVSQQAIALGTCYHRTSLIPEKQSAETRRLLGMYTGLLIESPTLPDMERNTSTLEALYEQIWKQASSLKQEQMDPELRALYVTSVNNVFDIYISRKTVVVVYRIPTALWAALLLLYILAMFVVGSGYHSPKNHRSINLFIMAAAFAMIVVLIAEMDNPTKMSRFTVNQQPLKDILKMMKEDAVQKIQ